MSEKYSGTLSQETGFRVFVLITVGMRPYRYLTGFPKAKDKEITLLPIFCYQRIMKAYLSL